MVFKKKKTIEEDKEIAPVEEVESPDAEELVETASEEEMSPEGDAPTLEDLDDELNDGINQVLAVINQRLLRLEAEGYRRLN